MRFVAKVASFPLCILCKLVSCTYLLCQLQKFVVPLLENTAVISHEDYHPVFSNIQVRCVVILFPLPSSSPSLLDHSLLSPPSFLLPTSLSLPSSLFLPPSKPISLLQLSSPFLPSSLDFSLLLYMLALKVIIQYVFSCVQ